MTPLKMDLFISSLLDEFNAPEQSRMALSKPTKNWTLPLDQCDYHVLICLLCCAIRYTKLEIYGEDPAWASKSIY